MRRQQRRISTFSLSFLDIMACGFGAVTLLFLILKHGAMDAATVDPRFGTEIELLHQDLRTGEQELAQLRNSLADIEQQAVAAQGLADRVQTQINDKKRERSIQSDVQEDIPLLRKKVRELEKKTSELRETGRDKDLRRFVGDGDRQYLTGLKLGGRRILILVDSSASMLDDRIVNIVRLRNMSASVQRNSAKWRRAVRTVEWLVAQIPRDSQYQIYTFNTVATALNPASDGRWQNANDSATLDTAMRALKQQIPHDGTSLINAFNVVHALTPRADNIFLITDGLPTQGQKPPRGNTVSGKERIKLFTEAAQRLPGGIPVNIVLFPMEGDPDAAALFWQLSLASKGAFLSPASDWP